MIGDTHPELLAAADKLATIAQLIEGRADRAANDAGALNRMVRSIAGTPVPATLRESAAAMIAAEDAAVLCFHLEHPVTDPEPESDAADLITDVGAILARYLQAVRDQDTALWDAGMSRAAATVSSAAEAPGPSVS